MRVGVLIDVRHSVAQICDDVARYAEQGFASAWASQIFGYDAMTLLGVVGAQTQGIELGTAVVPVYSRIPQVMAQQALTAQAASGGRFVLGIGMSHEVVVQGMWGISYDRPARYLREYLSALMPMVRGEAVHFDGEVLTARSAGPLEIPDAGVPPVLVAALGPTMLRLAGRLADGTVTWMTGTKTVAEHIVPTIGAAAHEHGRPRPRVVVSLPVCVTDDADAAARLVDEVLAIYPTLPAYRAMLEREGASAPSDVALIGDEDTVAAGVGRLADTGATDFVASIVGSREERSRSAHLLGSLA